MTPKLGCRGQKIERSLNFWREPLGLFHYTLLLQGEGQCGAECDVSVSKLLGLETFPIFGIVSDSVSKKIWYRKKYRIRYIGKNLLSKKLSDSVSEIYGTEESIGFVMGKK